MAFQLPSLSGGSAGSSSDAFTDAKFFGNKTLNFNQSPVNWTMIGIIAVVGAYIWRKM